MHQIAEFSENYPHAIESLQE
uniref:Uncharacterized protein n=1 Tax=Arundo donax TaxID=35708 RepID=A0A0A8ZE17_ARUDO